MVDGPKGDNTRASSDCESDLPPNPDLSRQAATVATDLAIRKLSYM